MGKTDRVTRILLAISTTVLYFTGTISVTPGIILIIVAGIFLLTSFINFCPVYKLPGIFIKKK